MLHAIPRYAARAVCAVGYGSYLKPAEKSGLPSTIPAACDVLPASGPSGSCSCFACPPGTSSRGGVISRAACVPLHAFSARLTLFVPASAKACDRSVINTLIGALATAADGSPDAVQGATLVEFVSCGGDPDKVRWLPLRAGGVCTAGRQVAHHLPTPAGRRMPALAGGTTARPPVGQLHLAAVWRGFGHLISRLAPAAAEQHRWHSCGQAAWSSGGVQSEAVRLCRQAVQRGGEHHAQHRTGGPIPQAVAGPGAIHAA